MRLTLMSDYAMRLLMHVAKNPQRLCTITSAAPVEDTTLAMWNKTMDILSTGYFLVGREGYRLMKRQGLGGSMVFIASKNAIAASPGASAYCTAKAAEVHLACSSFLFSVPIRSGEISKVMATSRR